ncbi:MAG: hypothetical protein R3F53_21255 [Gammaproteobacteria bacterium]
MLNISTGSPVSTTSMVAGFIVSGLESADFVIMWASADSGTPIPACDYGRYQWVTEFASNDSWQNHPTAATVRGHWIARAAPWTQLLLPNTLPPGVYLAWLESEKMVVVQARAWSASAEVQGRRVCCKKFCMNSFLTLERWVSAARRTIPNACACPAESPGRRYDRVRR